jgi:molybdenum cofactor guanylyltransferase
MGSDKAALPWDGGTMLERIVAQLRRVFADIVIVAGEHQRTAVSGLSDTAVRAVWDAEHWDGPVRALRLGLSTAREETAFACACDLPLLDAGLALALCDLAGGHDAAIPMVEERLQMLHGAYRKSCLHALDAMIARGAHRLRELAPALDVRLVNEDELRQHDPQLLSFFNVNTPEDYARALRLSGNSSP